MEKHGCKTRLYSREGTTGRELHGGSATTQQQQHIIGRALSTVRRGLAGAWKANTRGFCDYWKNVGWNAQAWRRVSQQSMPSQMLGSSLAAALGSKNVRLTWHLDDQLVDPAAGLLPARLPQARFLPASGRPLPAAQEQPSSVALKDVAAGQGQQHAVQRNTQQAQQDAALSGLLRKVRVAHGLRGLRDAQGRWPCGVRQRMGWARLMRSIPHLSIRTCANGCAVLDCRPSLHSQLRL